MHPQVDILLATYNGEKFLEELLESIFTQSYLHFRILVRDDGSSDGTSMILDRYVDRYPKKIVRIISPQQLGTKNNFSELMHHTESPYVFFCDQDDVWFPDKIANSLLKMSRLENEFGPDTPLLVHTDLKVVDENLQMINPSFWNFAGLKPYRSHSLNRILLQNVVTGCTALINKPLLQLARPIPPGAVMHDWWIAIVAAAFGKIATIDRATMYYRQHPSNMLGAKNYDYKITFKELLDKLSMRSRKGKEQAKAFVERFQKDLSKSQEQLLKVFVLQSQCNWWERRYRMLQYRFFNNDLKRNLVEFLLGWRFE
jgi:glycosyltransferase involved in cell wall biosynthesis